MNTFVCKEKLQHTFQSESNTLEKSHDIMQKGKDVLTHNVHGHHLVYFELSALVLSPDPVVLLQKLS